nr:putative efflux pump kojt [Quercus suber]
MQSYLQYKRLRATVQAQIDKDRAKARDWNVSSTLGNRSGPRDLSSAESNTSSIDLEKGGHPDHRPSESNAAAASGESAVINSQDSGSRRDSELEPAEEKEESPASDAGDDGDQDEAGLDEQRTLSRVSTQKSSGTGLGNVLTGVDVRRRTTGEGGSGNVFVVDWQGPDDPNSPHNWSSASQRVPCTILVAAIGCVVGIASAIDSSALRQASEEFGVSEVVESMATGLYLIGFGFGALFAGPFSETFGRNPVYFVTMGIYMIFIMASGLAPNIGAQLAFRFLAGLDSSALRQASEEFGVSEVVESMATGLYLIGFGFGALFAGPFSETFGRNPVYFVTMGIYMIFIMASGLAPNIGAQLAFRFLAGFFGSTPLTCAGGSISDLWSPMERVYRRGPVLGPVIGGFIAESSLISWRWTEWITLIISGLVFALVVLFQPETHAPTLLKWKAKHLRDITGDDRYRAAIEVREESFWSAVGTALYRPFLLTFREPIIILIALYMTVVYIILFTFLDGYDYIFGQIHRTSQGITGLCFLGIFVGLCGASALVPIIYKWAKEELARVQEAGGDRIAPEFRLWFAMLGGSFAIPISLFWMAWTSDPDISIWSPLAASVLFGYGILCVFISGYQYIIDSYEIYAASALASITLIRYVAAGGMTIVGIPFYKNLGVHYTLTILACLSALLAPVPYVFYKYGPWIRSKSKYAVDMGSPASK